MKECIFLVKEAEDGGFSAKALDEDIFTDGNTVEELRENIKDAVACHFDDGQAPEVIRLHFIREEVLAL